MPSHFLEISLLLFWVYVWGHCLVEMSSDEIKFNMHNDSVLFA